MLVRLDGDLGGLFRAADRRALRCGRAGGTAPAEDRCHPIPCGEVRLVVARATATPRRGEWRRRPAATSWISSPLPNGRPTGAETTTSPTACSPRCRLERHPRPAWVVVSAGTGGTSSTIGRHIRYRQHGAPQTKLCVVDPERSVFFDAFRTGDWTLRISASSRIEGIGRPRVEPSFLPSVVDRMMRVPDAASIAAVHWLETVIGRKCGGLTGTNLVGALTLAEEMITAREGGSLVTLICDPGERYLGSYYDAGWLREEGLDPRPHQEWLETFRDYERPERQRSVSPSTRSTEANSVRVRTVPRERKRVSDVAVRPIA